MNERNAEISEDREPPGAVEEAAALEAFAKVSPVGLFRTDPQGRCTDVNARWCAMTGLTPEEALGNGWLRAIHPEDRALVSKEWERAWMEQRDFRCEYRYRWSDGRTVWVLGQARLVHDEDDRVIGLSGSATDVTELRAMRQTLHQQQAGLEATLVERTQKLYHMAMAVEASGEAVLTTDCDRTIVSWNKAAELMFGWTAGEMIGKSVHHLLPPELVASTQQLYHRVHGGERIESFESLWRVRSGAFIEVALSAFPLRDGRSKIVGMCSVLRNVTELRQAERRLQRLSRRLLEAQDEERRRLARELHDSAAQTVIALSMNLALLKSPGSFRSEEKWNTLLSTCLDLAASAARELRTTVYLLHPPLLDDRGLGPALEWFLGGFQARSGIAVALEVDPALQRLPARVELALFRVAQESLSNVHRHSGSTSATVRLRRDDDAWVLQIQDAGHGLRDEEPLEEGVGVSGMRERMAELGGTFEIQFSAQGSTATARLPTTVVSAFPTKPTL